MNRVLQRSLFNRRFYSK